jgi:hypothetical protein
MNDLGVNQNLRLSPMPKLMAANHAFIINFAENLYKKGKIIDNKELNK